MNKVCFKKEFYIAETFIILNKEENRRVIDEKDYDNFYNAFFSIAEKNDVKIDSTCDFDEDYYINEYVFKDNDKYVLYPWVDYSDLEKQFNTYLSTTILSILNNPILKESITNRNKNEVLIMESKYMKLFEDEEMKLNNEIKSLEFEKERKIKKLEKVLNNKKSYDRKYN